MELSVARQLIEGGVKQTRTAQHWADLGAGNGLFTQALSWLLADRSVIDAVDQSPGILDGISGTSPNVEVKCFHQNFETDPLPFSGYDGIIMANALHFVQDKNKFFSFLLPSLSSNGVLIVVEYNLSIGNRWVPFPITFHSLKNLAGVHDLRKATLLGEVSSKYHTSGMYAASFQF